MIHLVRPAEPDDLIRNHARWTDRWTASCVSGQKIEWATRAAKNALKAPLLALTRGKCAFCESVLNVTSFIEIEHYHAKTVKQELVFHWPNLFPACGRCNNKKNDVDHQGRLLKPDEENPEPLLWLHRATGELQPHPNLAPHEAKRVDATIEAYDLQRGPLCIERLKKMGFVERWLRRLENGQGKSKECRDEWQMIVDPTTPWKFVIRHTLTRAGQPELAEFDRRRFLQES